MWLKVRSPAVGKRSMSLSSRVTSPSQVSRMRGVRGRSAVLGDFLELMKPRVMALVVFTALVGLSIAPGELDLSHRLIALGCIAAGAGGAGALNMWYEADIDAVMTR